MKSLGRKFIFLGVYSLISLLFYSIYLFDYSGLTFSGSWIGSLIFSPFSMLNDILAFSFFSMFGIAAYLAPLFLIYLTTLIYKQKSLTSQLERIVGFLILASGLATYGFVVQGFAYGGLLGTFFFRALQLIADRFLVKVFALGSVWAASVLIFRFAFMAPFRALIALADRQVLLQVAHSVSRLFETSYGLIYGAALWIKKCFTGQAIEEIQNELYSFEYDASKEDEIISKDGFWDEYKESPHQNIEPQKNTGVAPDANQEEKTWQQDFVAQQSEDFVKEEPAMHYNLPDLDIFTAVEDRSLSEEFDKELQFIARVLEEKLERFGVKGKVISIEYGPVITLFHYEPSPDCKVSKIVALEDDLALALEATSIRIIAPIPGKSVVGFEISNRHRKDVLFSSIVHSEQFKNFEGSLPLVLGEDSVGHKVVVDLATMPHLLIAGSTGSGKSVALNAMLVSLLCKCTPDQLKLILIDPKRLEFTSYSDIAHLLFPIITQPRYAVGVLKWVVQEMESRYERMSEVGSRNLFDYNNYCKANKLEELPFIVVVIDELADLMMTAGKDVEEQITRLAQMARASGIHMIVATQRPSVDVITGLIKVNFPSRISFRVTSRVDSKTILDGSGAEKLLGKGDMLFMDSRATRLKRVHGAYVSDAEINKIVSHVYSERAVEYLDLNELIMSAKKDSSGEEDEIFNDVKSFIDDIDEVSISLLQRKFRIGYNRSARIIDQLESQGLILPADGGKLRKVIKRD